jgi:hypothetical protein
MENCWREPGRRELARKTEKGTKRPLRYRAIQLYTTQIHEWVLYLASIVGVSLTRKKRLTPSIHFHNTERITVFHITLR